MKTMINTFNRTLAVSTASLLSLAVSVAVNAQATDGGAEIQSPRLTMEEVVVQGRLRDAAADVIIHGYSGCRVNQSDG